MDPLTQMYGGAPQQAQMQAPMGRTNKFNLPDNFDQVLAFGVLNGDIQPAQANLFMKLSGIGPEEEDGIDAKARQAMGIIDQIDQQVKDVGLQSNSLFGRTWGGLKKRFGGYVDPKIGAYEGFKGGTVTPLIKTLGESGNLSNEDVERAMNLVPDLTDSQTEADLKLKNLRGLVNTIYGLIPQDQQSESMGGMGMDPLSGMYY